MMRRGLLDAEAYISAVQRLEQAFAHTEAPVTMPPRQTDPVAMAYCEECAPEGAAQMIRRTETTRHGWWRRMMNRLKEYIA